MLHLVFLSWGWRQRSGHVRYWRFEMFGRVGHQPKVSVFDKLWILVQKNRVIIKTIEQNQKGDSWEVFSSDASVQRATCTQEYHFVNNLKHVKVSNASLNVLFHDLCVRLMCRTHLADDELSSELMVQDKRQKQEASSIEEELLISHRLLVSGGGNLFISTFLKKRCSEWN